MLEDLAPESERVDNESTQSLGATNSLKNELVMTRSQAAALGSKAQNPIGTWARRHDRGNSGHTTIHTVDELHTHRVNAYGPRNLDFGNVPRGLDQGPNAWRHSRPLQRDASRTNQAHHQGFHEPPATNGARHNDLQTRQSFQSLVNALILSRVSVEMSVQPRNR